MIYLIKSYTKYGALLKIGYCNEEGLSKRLMIYEMHNPGYELLSTIDNGTRRHEHKLHKKFKKYLYKYYGREWFNYSDEIVNYINSVTIQDLDNLFIDLNNDDDRISILLRSRKVSKLLEYVLKEEGRKDITTNDLKEMLKVVNLRFTTTEEIFEDLKCSNQYPSIVSKTWEELESYLFPSLPSELEKFLKIMIS